jgi:pathogenesis-related protein 1
MQHRTNCFIPLLSLVVLLSTGCAEQQKMPVSTKTSTTPVAKIPGINGLDGDEEQAILSYHNEVRASVKVPPLHWSKELAQHAANSIATLASKGCELRHSKDSNYGENLFMSTTDQNHETVIAAAKEWEGEKINYLGEALNKANRSQAGHYTQMVWRNTTELGCAKAVCGDKLIVACNYSPAGNILGQKPY